MSRAANPRAPAASVGGAIFRKLRSAFVNRWVRPTPHEAGQALARAAAEKRERVRLTEQERRDAIHRQLQAERQTPQWRELAGQR